MKRITLGALVVLLTVAAAAEETQRYLVATRRPVRELAVGSLSRELRERGDRRVTAFEHVFTGYAAELTASEADALRRSPEVRYLEPVVKRHLMADETVPGAQYIPLGVHAVRAPQAWAGTRSAMINVAVIDSGVDHRHPELAAAWAGGYDVFSETTSQMDGIGHGTHVAGTIAAGDNEFGVVGVAPNVRLWGVRAIDDTGEGTMDTVIEGLDWIVAKAQQEGGRWVVNFSLGGREPSTGEREAFESAVDKGLILVAATGNDSFASGPASVSYPAAYNGVLAVAALDERNEHAPFSNSGPEVDFAAPGVRVLSTDLFGYDFLSYIRANDRIFPTRPLEGSKDDGVAGEYVFCGLGSEADFTATNVRGKIALIQRGGDTFANKVRRANEAGALGVVVFNNDGSPDRWTLVSDEDPWSKTYAWPVAVALSKEIGEMLAEKGSGPMRIGRDSNDFSHRTGTSMATPHVTGAIAMLWSLAPNATAAQIYQALAATARDIGDPGKDNFNGHGLIDVNAAARRLAPGAFGDGPVDDGRSGRRLGRRTRR
jgi:serine protease